MTACKTPECHEEIKLCVKEKVPKSWIWKGLTAFLIPALAFSGVIWAKLESNDVKFAEKAVVAKNRTDINVAKSQINSINDQLKRLESGQLEIRKDIKILLQRTVK